jgi:hypothetical protein
MNWLIIVFVLLISRQVGSWVSRSRSFHINPNFKIIPSFKNRFIQEESKITLAGSLQGADDIFPSRPQSKTVFVQSSEDSYERIIIQNLNQIQFGRQVKIGILGTSELDENQQQMIELLAYALVLSGNHVFTSAGGGNGTNIAVIRGALRACNSDLLSVILPQSLWRQPPEMQTLLRRVNNVIEQPENDQLGLKEAANLCNYKLLSCVDKIIVFVYHDSSTILGPLEDFQNVLEIVKFYLD